MSTTGGERLPVAALVGDPVATVAPGATLRQVAEALVAGEVGALVVGSAEVAQGIVSERDVVRALAAGRDPQTTTAADIANTELIWCDASADVDDVANQMMERYVRHILLEEDGKLVGVVSARDLLGVYASEARADSD